MSYPSNKWLRLAVTAALAVCGAYVLAARLMGFIGASRQDKLIHLASGLLISGLLSYLLLFRLTPRLSSGLSRRDITRAALASVFLAAFLLIPFYKAPPFPEDHTLEITVLDQSSPLSAGRWVQVLSIQTYRLPGRATTNLAPDELNLEGSWLLNPGDSLLWQGGTPGTASYQVFLQGGMILNLRTGPEQGLLQIKWDGDIQTIDLYSKGDGSRVIQLNPPLVGLQADATRKALLLFAFLAEFVVLTILLFLAGIFLIHLSRSGWTIRAPRLLVYSAVTLLTLLLVSLTLLQPVQFQDPNLETLIRDNLQNPGRPIFRHQLLTIVRLDAANQHLSSLEGIQYLANLSDLNLANNLLQDISPLAKLKHLTSLNLRGNKLSNLAPLASSTSLVYLNLHSNPEIASLSPLSRLSNLSTLILAFVPAGDQLPILHNFPLLTHLNLRSSGVSDLTPLASLTRLQYLNLHSNPAIPSIQPILGLSNLTTLILADVPLASQASVLERFPLLQHLNLRNTAISDLSSLAGLTRLTYLNLHSNPAISSIAPLAGLSSLRTLILENVPVTDQVSVLANFPDLIKLNLRNTGIADTAFLGQLMAGGAFQDDSAFGLTASIDLLDNPIDFSSRDAYAPVRPYWEGISSRLPFALPVYAALDPPAFSYPAGFYTTPFLLELSTPLPGASIHYTLDGSEPSRQSPLYTAPIPIEEGEGQPYQLAENEDISPYWQSPDGDGFQARVVRASVFNQSGENSPAVTLTYFVDENISSRYHLPVISLSTDAANLFDYDDGIYVKGRIFDLNYNPQLENTPWQQDANYHQRGLAWERPAHVEVFEAGRQPGISQDAAVRIHGEATRGFPKKSLRIYASSAADVLDLFEYELFPGLQNQPGSQPIQEFKVFLLRNAGNDWDQTLMRDVLMQRLAGSTTLDTLASRPALLYLNGEYWGIYYLRQYLDENFLSSKYLVQPGEVVILESDVRIGDGSPAVLWGNPGDESHFNQMVQFVQENDLSREDNYEQVKTWMDVENFIEYQLAEIYSANFDWPYNNTAYWRTKTESYLPDAPYGLDGRWRWILFDTDFSLGYLEEYSSYQHDTLERAASLGENGILLSGLLDNLDFRNRFINRLADRLNTNFNPGNVMFEIDRLQSVLDPNMAEEIRRWRTMEDDKDIWLGKVEVLREFARQRPDVLRQQILDRFNLPGTATLAVESDLSAGFVRINSVDIRQGSMGVEDPASWSGIYFMGIPVHITAVANQNYRFSHWEGAESENPELTLVLEKDTALKAVFSRVP